VPKLRVEAVELGLTERCPGGKWGVWQCKRRAQVYVTFANGERHMWCAECALEIAQHLLTKDEYSDLEVGVKAHLARIAGSPDERAWNSSLGRLAH